MEDDADDITPPRPSELSSSLAVRAAEWGLEGHGPPETTDSRPASASSHTISRAFGKAGEARRGVHDREGVRRPVKPSFRGLVQKRLGVEATLILHLLLYIQIFIAFTVLL